MKYILLENDITLNDDDALKSSNLFHWLCVFIAAV